MLITICSVASASMRWNKPDVNDGLWLKLRAGGLRAAVCCSVLPVREHCNLPPPGGSTWSCDAMAQLTASTVPAFLFCWGELEMQAIAVEEDTGVWLDITQDSESPSLSRCSRSQKTTYNLIASNEILSVYFQKRVSWEKHTDNNNTGQTCKHRMIWEGTYPLSLLALWRMFTAWMPNCWSCINNETDGKINHPRQPG